MTQMEDNFKYHDIDKNSAVIYTPVSFQETQNLFPENGALQCVQSLKYDNLSAEEFDNVWQACSKYRLNQIQNECKSLDDVFKNWPEYKKPSGYRLIDKDFSVVFNDHEGLVVGWKTGLLKIYKFLKKDKNLKDPSSKLLLQSIQDTEIEAGDVSYIFKTLWCLHGYLYPTTKIIKSDTSGKKDVTRFTMKDSQESFIFVGQSLQQLECHIDYLKKRGENIQPFLLVISDQNFN